jgi:acyl-CoA thioesterase-1
VRPLLLFAAAIALAACSGPAPAGRETAPVKAPEPVVTTPASAPEPDTRKVLIVFGDSISAGYGLAPGLSYPDVMQRTLDVEKLPWRIVNQGVSGDTTAGGAARMQSAIDLKPSLVLLELGGNDGLRGLPLTATRENLEKMIVAFRAAGAQVILAGMSLPPNYGPDYIKGFEQIFRDLAAKYKLKLIPFLLSDMITQDLRYFQRDGIHPTEEGAEIVAKTALKTLRPLLK